YTIEPFFCELRGKELMKRSGADSNVNAPADGRQFASARKSVLTQVGDQRLACLVREPSLVTIVRMIDTDRDRIPCLRAARDLTRQLESQEMHRRGLFVVLPLEILIRNRKHAIAALDLHPTRILDPFQPR